MKKLKKLKWNKARAEIEKFEKIGKWNENETKGDQSINWKKRK